MLTFEQTPVVLERERRAKQPAIETLIEPIFREVAGGKIKQAERRHSSALKPLRVK
jgi:hypothetical protein